MRLLSRSPVLLLVLVVYPVLVALLVAVALQSDDRRPAVAVVVQDTSGRTVAVGDQRLGVDDYVARLAEDVDVTRLDAAAAQDALDAGRVTAVLTIPEGFISDLQSGVRQPVLTLDASRRTPIEADAGGAQPRVRRLPAQPAAGRGVRRPGAAPGGPGPERRPAGRLRAQHATPWAGAQPGGRDRPAAAAAGRRTEPPAAAQLDPILAFIDTTQRNLDLAQPAANAIRAPIDLASPRRRPAANRCRPSASPAPSW